MRFIYCVIVFLLVSFTTLASASHNNVMTGPFPHYDKFSEIYQYGLISYKANVYDCSNMASEFAVYLNNRGIEANLMVILVEDQGKDALYHAIVEMKYNGKTLYVDPSANRYSDTIIGLSYNVRTYRDDIIYFYSKASLFMLIKSGHEEFLPYDPRNKLR